MKTRNKNMIRIALLLAAVVLLYSLRPVIARTNPGLVAFVSLDDGPFTFFSSYDAGSVGPFTIGSSREISVRALNSYGKPFILPMKMSQADRSELYFRRQTAVGTKARSILTNSDSWRVAVFEQGATAVYDLRFVDDRLKEIRLTSTLVA